MARTWTPEQAASLAPDPASLKAAQGLSAPRKWSGLGGDGQFIWGLAQGSGAEPYQSQIDLSEPAFKCSCPSRKFPCKHGLGLLLLYASQPNLCPTAPRPPWVEEWISKRAERTAKAAAKKEDAASAPPDPAAQAKRREKREANVQQGVEFLQGWLGDLARQGLSSVSSGGYAFWDATARRMIDAQAPGLARRVRELGGLASQAGVSETRILAEVGRLHLLLQAYSRRQSLPPEWQLELEAQAGWPVDQDGLRQSAGVPRAWFVGAQTVREEDRLITRTTYLFSHDSEPAKILEFTHATQAAVSSLALGRWVEAEAVCFPGVASLRAILKTPPRDLAPQARPVVESCAEILERHAHRLALNPLAEETPVIARLTPLRRNDHWAIRDQHGAALPLVRRFTRGWELLSCAGGRPIDLCGVWDGVEFLPLSVVVNETVLSLDDSRA